MASIKRVVSFIDTDKFYKGEDCLKIYGSLKSLMEHEKVYLKEKLLTSWAIGNRLRKNNKFTFDNCEIKRNEVIRGNKPQKDLTPSGEN